MNRKEREALCERWNAYEAWCKETGFDEEEAEEMCRLFVADNRRLVEVLEQIKFWSKQAIPRDAVRSRIAYLGDLARRALDGEDND